MAATLLDMTRSKVLAVEEGVSLSAGASADTYGRDHHAPAPRLTPAVLQDRWALSRGAPGLYAAKPRWSPWPAPGRPAASAGVEGPRRFVCVRAPPREGQ
jgi:hypothetical protein